MIESRIEYHDPRAPTAVKATPYELTASIRGANKIGIGFLANGFPDSVNFLTELQTVLTEKEPGITVFSYNKGNASIPAGEALLSEITADCQAVIAAYGH